jgi:hypothetical protein
MVVQSCSGPSTSGRSLTVTVVAVSQRPGWDARVTPQEPSHTGESLRRTVESTATMRDDAPRHL